MRTWGYWATLLWAVIAFVAGQLVGLVVPLLWRNSDLSSLLATPFDGVTVALFILISNPITIAVLAAAVWFARAPQVEYFALTLPAARPLWTALACLIGLIAVSDGLLYFGGYPLVTPFQLLSYTTAAADGWLPILLFGAIIMAPAGEEIMFRGFLFRGWARSERSAWPAIIVISILWSALHIQYDWTGILQVFIFGLFLGWTRWRSGSTLLTFLLHALFNAEGTLETLVQIRFFS
jgi:uncharacterized protein